MLNREHNIQQISIPEPCNQPWQQMTEANDGRFCASCAKVVVDFTAMTNDEIISHLSTSNKVCGRFDERQFSGLNREFSYDQTTRGNFWKRTMLAASLLVSAYTAKSQVATVAKPATEQAPGNFPLGKIAISYDTLYFTISGHVCDNTNASLPGVIVKIAGTNSGTVTNSDGNFTVKVPQSALQLTVSFIGYKSQTITIKHSADVQQLDIKLEDADTRLTGELVVVKRASFLKWMYGRLVKRPIKKIFG